MNLRFKPIKDDFEQPQIILGRLQSLRLSCSEGKDDVKQDQTAARIAPVCCRFRPEIKSASTSPGTGSPKR